MRNLVFSCVCLALLACGDSDEATSPVPPPTTVSAATTQVGSTSESVTFPTSPLTTTRPSPPGTTMPSTSTTTVPVTSVERVPGPSLTGTSLDSCRLTDRTPDRRLRYSLITGFPVRTENFEPSGVFDIALIPIDFEDLPGDQAGPARVADQMEKVTQWYQMVSGGRVEIRWRVYPNWIRMPRPSLDFALERSRSDDNALANAAFAAADPFVDFSGIRAGIFLLPLSSSFMAEGVQGFIHSQFGPGGYVTAEGPVHNYAIGGIHWEHPQRPIWTYWAHEIGHMFPLPDLYDVRSQWWIGAELEIPGGPFSGFDMMANQDGPSRTLSTWLRFVMGWLDDEQVLCVDIQSEFDGEATLVPIDHTARGVKAIMMPLSPTRIAVIESRRPHPKFDCDTPRQDAKWRSRSGVIVYVADMTVGHGNGFQSLIAPEGRGLNGPPDGCSVPQQLDAILTPGDSVSFEGVTVTLLSSGTFDTVHIHRE